MDCTSGVHSFLGFLQPGLLLLLARIPKTNRELG